MVFLHTLASPQVLNVDASVEKSLVRPIVLRDQLLKDGLKVRANPAFSAPLMDSTSSSQCLPSSTKTRNEELTKKKRRERELCMGSTSLSR